MIFCNFKDSSLQEGRIRVVAHSIVILTTLKRSEIFRDSKDPYSQDRWQDSISWTFNRDRHHFQYTTIVLHGVPHWLTQSVAPLRNTSDHALLGGATVNIWRKVTADPDSIQKSPGGWLPRICLPMDRWLRPDDRYKWKEFDDKRPRVFSTLTLASVSHLIQILRLSNSVRIHLSQSVALYRHCSNLYRTWSGFLRIFILFRVLGLSFLFSGFTTYLCTTSLTTLLF